MNTVRCSLNCHRGQPVILPGNVFVVVRVYGCHSTGQEPAASPRLKGRPAQGRAMADLLVSVVPRRGVFILTGRCASYLCPIVIMPLCSSSGRCGCGLLDDVGRIVYMRGRNSLSHASSPPCCGQGRYSAHSWTPPASATGRSCGGWGVWFGRGLLVGCTVPFPGLALVPRFS